MTKIQFWQLVYVKVILNLKSEANKTYLNYAWWILEPAMFVAVFYLVFGMVLKTGGEDFVPFLVSGLIPFLWFSKSVVNSSGSITQGRNLIRHVAISKLFFPLVVVFQDTVKEIPAMVLMVLILTFSGFIFSYSWLFLIPIVLVQIAFITACGFVAASIVPIIPDFRFIVVTLMQLLLFGSGVFYDYKEYLDVDHHKFFLLNPIATLIDNYRVVLLEGNAPDFLHLLVIVLASFVVILVMSWIMNRYKASYSRWVQQ